MIQKFNFYDIYGYFVPGAAFLAILCVPFGVVRHTWPSSTWSDAIIAAVLAYILGHLVQSIATNAIPSWEVKGRTGQNRFPSEIYLDSTDKELPKICKDKLEDLINHQFGLDLEVDKVGDDDIDRVRHNAFLLARQILIQGKAVSYAEQFQGMYVLTRGLVSVLALGSADWMGFAAAALFRSASTVSFSILIFAASLLALANVSLFLLLSRPEALKRRRIELGYSLVLLIAFFFVGYGFALRYPISATQAILLVFLAAWAIIGCLRAYGAYKYFAGQFAAAVWRDYLAYNVAAAMHHTAEAEAD